MHEPAHGPRVPGNADPGAWHARRLAAEADELIAFLVTLDREGFHDLGPTRDHVETVLDRVHRASLTCQERGQIGLGELLHSLSIALRGLLRLHSVRPDPDWTRLEEHWIEAQRPVTQVIESKANR